jgi:hypothetical protein
VMSDRGDKENDNCFCSFQKPLKMDTFEDGPIININTEAPLGNLPEPALV